MTGGIATTMPQTPSAIARAGGGSRRRWIVWVGLAGVVAGFVLGAVAYRWKKHAAAKYVPPVFTEPGPGPRAPASEWLGVRVGVTPSGGVQFTTGSWALSCADKGMRAMMTELRDKKREEIARAEARGAPDTVSGASILTRRTARDDNPQVRWNCDRVPSSALRDRTRPLSSGRLLFVFDDARAPVRHASYQRSHREWSNAVADFNDALRAVSERFGRPAGKGAESATEVSIDSPLPKYGRQQAEWRFSDLVATVSVANLGASGYSVSEAVEVPWPVRADAPAR
jgi:hypothetical protein